MPDVCPICATPYDDLGICDWYCPRVIAEDDQLRAEAAEAQNAPSDETDEAIKRGMELALDSVALVMFNARMRRFDP